MTRHLVVRARRRLNSSRMIPGWVRQLVGGRVYSSGDYRVLGTGEAAAQRALALSGWHEQTVATRQDRLWQRPGMVLDSRPDLRNLHAAIEHFAAAATILEVGCGTGYNGPVLARRGATVIGIDSSAAMAAGAGARLQGRSVRGDATALPFGDRSIDLLVDGGALIHTVDWRRSLAEQARVARLGLVLHTVTITDHATTYLRKRAYGYPVAEVVLNVEELADYLRMLGLRLVSRDDGILYDLADVVGISTRSQTWVLDRDDLAPPNGPHIEEPQAGA